MSLPESSPDRPRGVLVRRPQTTIYTVLLFIALVCLAIGCAILALEWSHYGFQYNPSPGGRISATSVSISVAGQLV